MTAQARIHQETRKVAEPATTASATFLGSAAGVGILAFVLANALNPARTHAEMAGMFAAAFGSSMFVGPLVIEYYGMTNLSFEAKMGVCFIVASFSWLAWSIVSVQLRRWRDAKNPLRTAASDIRSARGLDDIQANVPPMSPVKRPRPPKAD